MDTPQRHVVGHELAIGQEVVVFGLAVTEVMTDRLEDLPQSLSTLRPCGVVDHVFGHELVEGGGIALDGSLEERLNDRLRFRHLRP